MPEETPSDATTAGSAARARAAGAVALVMCALWIVASVLHIVGSGGGGASPDAIESASPDAPLAILTPLAPDRLATATAPAPPATPSAREPAPPLARDAVEPVPGRPGDAIRDIPVRVEAGDGRPFAGALATFTVRSGRIPAPVTRTARLDEAGEVDLPIAFYPTRMGEITIGLLSIEGGPPGIVEAHARAVEPFAVDVSRPEDLPIVFRLPSLRPTRILVLGPLGAPSPGARVALGWDEDHTENRRSREAVADALGIAAVPGLVPGEVYARAVSSDGLAATQTGLIVDPVREPLTLRLEGPGTLVVTAEDTRGAPVLLPLGLAVEPESFIGPPVSATALPGGVSEARVALAPGRWSLALGEGGYEAFPGFEERPFDILPGVVLRVVATAPPTGRLEGVVRAAGRPVEGARVFVGGERVLEQGGPLDVGLATDAEGRFLATRGGDLVVAVLATGFARAVRRVRVEPGKTVALAIDLEAPASLSVFATTPAGITVNAWDLSVFQLDGGAEQLHRGASLSAPGVDHAGLRFTDLAPGRYLAALGAAAAEVTLASGDDKVVTLVTPGAPPKTEAAPTGTAVVRLEEPLLDDRGHPQELVVEAFAETGPLSVREPLEGGVARLTLPAGAATLEIHRSGTRVLLARPLDVTILAGREVAVILPRPALGTLEVRLEGLPPEERGPTSPWELVVEPLADGAGRPVGRAVDEDLDGDVVRLRVPAPAAYLLRLRSAYRQERRIQVFLEPDRATAVSISLPGERLSAVLRFDGDLPVAAVAREPFGRGVSRLLRCESIPASEEPGEARIAGVRLEPGRVRLELGYEGDSGLRSRYVEVHDLADGADLRIAVPRLGKGRIAAFVPPPAFGRGSLDDVRLVGPAGPLAPSWRGRVAWDRLPAGTYRLEVAGALAREVTLEEGGMVELGLVEAP